MGDRTAALGGKVLAVRRSCRLPARQPVEQVKHAVAPAHQREVARVDQVAAADIDHLKRPVSRQIVDQVWITTSGIFSQPPFIAALQTFGIDRIMFSIDYPFAPNAAGREFLDNVALSPADMAKLTHGNADALLKLKA